MNKLEGDVAAADKDNLGRQAIELQKLRTGGQMLLTRDVQRGAACTRRDHDVPSGKRVITNSQRRLVDEPRQSMHRANTGRCEAELVLLRCRVGEGALEAHQVRPIDGQGIGRDAISRHAAVPVHQLGATDQHFFGVTSAQLAGAAERSRVDYRDTPAGLSAGVGNRAGSGTGAVDNQITLYENRASR
jgi:hypothetical protein